MHTLHIRQTEAGVKFVACLTVAGTHEIPFHAPAPAPAPARATFNILQPTSNASWLRKYRGQAKDYT